MKKRRIKKIISILLAGVLISSIGFSDIGVKVVKAAEPDAVETMPAVITANQINWTGNELKVYDANVNNVEHRYRVNGGSLTISGTARINVKADATGSLSSLTIGDGSWICVEEGATANISVVNNQSYGGSFGAGVAVEENAGVKGVLSCSSLNNTARVCLFGTVSCSGIITNQDDFEMKSGSNVSCAAFSDSDTLTNAGSLTISGNLSTNKTINSGTISCGGKISSGLSVDNTGTITCTGFEGNGNFTNASGATLTITGGSYDCGGGQINNAGTINAAIFTAPFSGGDNTGIINADRVVYDRYSNMTNSTGTINVADSLDFSDITENRDLTTFSVKGNTLITSPSNVSFGLKVDGGTAVSVNAGKTESYDAKEASWVAKSAPTLSIGFSIYSDFVYGKVYNYGSYITTSSDGTPQITFKTATDSWGDVVTGDAYTTPPTQIGTYVMYVDVPETSDYRAVSGRQAFKIEGISMGSVYCTIEQTQSAPEYYNTPVTLVAPDGYEISPDDGETVPFASKYTLTEDGWYYGVPGVYREISTGGKSDPNGNHGLYDGWFYIDQTPPEVLQETAIDQDDNPVTVTIEDGAVIKARSLRFTVKDEILDYARTLKSVTVDGTSIDVDQDFGTAEVSLFALYPGTKTHKIVAEDEAGNTSVWNILLEYLPTATPETPYTLSGTLGKNGYYTSDVDLIPADGFGITDDVNSNPLKKITYTANLETVYLIKDIDGTFTSAIPVEKVLIDKIKPAISDKVINQDGIELDLENGGEVHARKIDFSVSDVNLTSVTLNGEAIEVVDGKADISIKADRNEIKSYKVVAEDIAGNTSEVVFSLKYSLKPIPEATLTIGDTIVGTEYSIILETNSDGKNEAELYYKAKGAGDDAYTLTKPITAGEYVVQARIPETETYEATKCEDTFNLSYLKAPEIPYTISGKKGNNNYYVADVYLNAPDGYSIATSAGGAFVDSVLYSNNLSSIYLRRSDGALTGAIEVKENLKIDKLAPEFLQGTNGSTIYSDNMSVTVRDDHLLSLTVDGDKVSGSKEDAVAELDPENGIKTFKMIAEDEAGNTSSLTMTLKATWLRDKVIPANKVLPLVKSESYKLDSGKWTVSGDSTVYSGGWDVYVNTDGSYTFTKQN